MVARKMNLLHVEDNRVQQRMLANLLKALPEFDFDITVVESEDDAIAEFSKGGFEFVLLDYQLTQGDGLQCLLRLRQHDPLVPIIAVSATATSEVAADLIRGGADDYLNKLDLTFETFAHSVREAMGRTDLFRRRLPSADLHWSRQVVEALLPTLCQAFLTGPGPSLLEQMDTLESAARQARLSPEQLLQEFERVGQEWDAVAGRRPAKHILRPLSLELFWRLFGSHAPGKDGAS